MSALVLDASAALNWCFKDEFDDAAEQLLDRFAKNGALAPSLWPTEMANILLSGERRGRIAPGDVKGAIAILRALPITIGPALTDRVFRHVVRLARAEGLTAYDAVYLDLALSQGVPLATRDRELAAAAHRRGVELIL